MKEHVPAALGTSACHVSPWENTWFLECGFILHPMANAVIRAVSSVKGLKQEQRRLFLGTLGQCLSPYQVPALLVVLIFHVQNAKGGSLSGGEESEMGEKQSMSLAGVPGITCVACLIFLSLE